jgi:abortive infection bacteriophage resistance protein
MNIADEQAAEKTLSRISYFRLAAYLRPMEARIWNRNYPVTPDIPANLPETWLTNTKVPFNKLYAQLCCIAYLLNSIEPQNTFAADIKTLLSKYAIVDPAAMGFVKDWQNEPLWR